MLLIIRLHLKISKPELNVGYETQSVNDGSSEIINFKNNINGFNFNFGYKNTEFGNYEFQMDLHEEEHDGHDEHDDEEIRGGVTEENLARNSDFAVEAYQVWHFKGWRLGYVGISIDNLESVYGIPFHGDEHGR